MKGIDTGSDLSIERYQSNCTPCCVSVIQVALAIILVAGITVAVLSHFKYLDHNFIYYGSAASTASFIVLGILTCFQPNNLEPALNDVTSFADLKTLLDSAEVSIPCCNYANCVGADNALGISSEKLGGSISSHQLNRKIENMLKHPKTLLSNEEKQKAREIIENLNKQCSDLNTNEQFSISDNLLKNEDL